MSIALVVPNHMHFVVAVLVDYAAGCSARQTSECSSGQGIAGTTLYVTAPDSYFVTWSQDKLSK